MIDTAVTLTAIDLLATLMIAGLGCMLVGVGIGKTLEGKEMKKLNPPLYIFDLDGTIANVDHRRHLVEKKPQRWDAFYKACVDDTPNTPVIATMELLLAAGCEVQIFSGREDSVRKETVAWLTQHTSLNMKTTTLLMRPTGDSTPDDVLKKNWYENVLTAGERRRLVAVFDDRDKVVAMWRSMGVPCFQVAPGDF